MPKLRSHLEAIPIRRGPDLYIAIRDVEGLNPETLVLSPQAYFIVSLMDGSNSTVDIQAAFMRKFGHILYRENVAKLIDQLDANLFLDNERSRDGLQRLITEFREQPSRRSYHAGVSYDADPEALRNQLKSFFDPENGGPGDPGLDKSGRTLLGLVAPHIDLRAGGPCFAHAYKAMVEANPVSTCVILGTGHEPLQNYFSLTRKGFETPLGLVSADNDFIDELSSRCSMDLFADEFAHRREHTIEFQTIFLKLLLPHLRIVPILCSFGVEEMEQQVDPILEMVQSLRETLHAYPQPVCLLASVDLAHIGPRYGDSFRPHAGTVAETQDEDGRLLETLTVADAEAFTSLLVNQRNRRRICGLPPLYVMLKSLEGQVEGELLHYDYTEVDGDHSFVTFASLALYEKDVVLTR
ncbi:MAG: AmmeMemoRadiSam system protein B [Deltaproteobacteria bacterium]|nr:MAG: AmmeMemoRadiSam system protein B [Deltaproteobacteria bacterium]